MLRDSAPSRLGKAVMDALARPLVMRPANWCEHQWRLSEGKWRQVAAGPASARSWRCSSAVTGRNLLRVASRLGGLNRLTSFFPLSWIDSPSTHTQRCAGCSSRMTGSQEITAAGPCALCMAAGRISDSSRRVLGLSGRSFCSLVRSSRSIRT